MQSSANHRSQRRGPRRSNAADANAADSNFESLNRAKNESDREGEGNATWDEDTYDVSQDVGVTSVEETSNSREDELNSPNNREGDRENCRFPEAALNAFRTREEELIEMCSDDERW